VRHRYSRRLPSASGRAREIDKAWGNRRKSLERRPEVPGFPYGKLRVRQVTTHIYNEKELIRPASDTAVELIQIVNTNNTNTALKIL